MANCVLNLRCESQTECDSRQCYRKGWIMKGVSRLDWIKFGVEGLLLSIIGSATCGCAAELYASFYDVFNMLSPVLLGIGVILLIVGIAGAALTKDAE